MFPNCSFHAKKQHFAVADIENNCIILYDLRTATRIGRPLKMHKSAIRAIEFNHNGSYLCSYSGDYAPMLCCWKLNVIDGVLGFFGSQSKCVEKVPLNTINTQSIGPLECMNNTKIIWDPIDRSKVKLQREDKSVSYFNIL